METHLSIATSVVQTLQKAGHIAYFAGGWVRDFLLKCPSDDIDIATSASIEEIATLFPKTIPVGASFGILIVVEKGHSFEVATFRTEKDYLDGRRPLIIAPASPEEDALRRDFTINGMFYDPLTKTLYDFVGGKEDLERKTIKAIGNPKERFLEDRLRMMRAARYSTRFGFTIETKTQEAILLHAKDLFPSVSIERVCQEFKKMAHFAHFDKSLLLLHKLSLLGEIFPELKPVSSHEIEKRLLPITDYPKETPTIIPLLRLFPKASLEKRLGLCDLLKLSNEEKEFVKFFHHLEHMVEMPEEWQESLEPIEWAYSYADPRSATFLKILEAHASPNDRAAFANTHAKRQAKLQTSILRIQEKKPLVTAAHLLQEGIPPGKQMGMLLKEAEKIAARKDTNSPAFVIEELKTNPLWRV